MLEISVVLVWFVEHSSVWQTTLHACMQATLGTGNGTHTFDPGFWLSEDRTECTINDEMGNFVFGKGARSCVGRHLAVIELVAFLAVLAREVSAVKMSEKEMERPFTLLGGHPTGMPLQLLPRS